MANLKRQPITYRQFEGQAILADGLLAVTRPGGEVEQALADALFGAADTFGKQAERQAQTQGETLGRQAVADAIPSLTVTGGEQNNPITPEVTSTSAAASPTPTTGTTAQTRAPASIRDTIVAAAAKYGVPPGALLRVAEIESSLNPKAKNPNSSASGLFQFVSTTAAQYGVTDPFDAAQSADAGARLMRDNTNYLRTKLGRDPTVGELYLAHQQGAAGAMRLLSNPGRLAVAAVGGGAVRLNGGNASMTAGEFAGLWTRKAGDKPVGPGLGPIAIDQTPGVQPLGATRTPLEISASGGKLALTGRDTIYGRAYDAAASKAYLGQLNDEMLTASEQLFEKYKDEPEELAGAFEQLKQVQMAEHVPAALRADYELGFATIQRRYLAGAQSAREAKIEAEALDAHTARGDSLNESVAKATAGLDAGNPASLQILQAEAARRKAHDAQAVARGWLSPKAAADNATELDGNVAVAFHLKQAEGKSPDDIEDLRQAMRADYAAGKLQGVDEKAWVKLDAGLKGLANKTEQEASANTSKLEKVAENFLTRAASGYDVPAKEIDDFRRTAGKVENGDQIVGSTLQVLDIARMLQVEPLSAAEAKVRDLRELAGKTPSAVDAAMLVTADAMVATARTSLATDLLGHAERMGIVGVTGSVTDATTAEDLAVLVEQRIEASDTAARHFGVDGQFFKPGEVKALDAMVIEDPEKGAAIAAAIVRGGGARASEILLEFGKSAPVLAGAGAILADGGDVLAAQDSMTLKDREGKAFKAKGWQERRTKAKEFTETALVYRPDDAERVTATAERIARKRMDDEGIEADDQQAADIHERALNEAAGAVFAGNVQYGGFTDYDPGIWRNARKVVVPNSIRADRFADVIDALRAEDLTVQPLGGVESLQDLWPVPVSGGYAFVDFDADGNALPRMDTDGRMFLLDLGGLAAKIGPRLPGAFRGH